MTRFGMLAAATAALLGGCTDDVEPGVDGGVEPPASATFTVRIENVAPWTVLKAGLQATKVVPAPGPLGPGEAYDITFTAGRNQRLGFAAMLGESNDWFFAPAPEGIPLHADDGTPVTGDVTDQVYLWDAGTEIDEEPAVGASTGPRQPAPDAGDPDPDPTVRRVGEQVTLTSGATFTRPAIADMIRVTVTPGNNRQFTVRIANVSTSTTLVTSEGTREIHVSPTVWALHTQPAPIFAEGAADRGQGLERVAEAGRGADLASVLGALSGAATPISRGVYAVHRGDTPLYTLGEADAGVGLERLAESGDPQPLADAMAARADELVETGTFTTPVGADAPGAVRPGQAYELTVTAEPGDRFSFATMFGMSNDWFFGTDADGIPLFDGDVPIRGDVTWMVRIHDAGTEIDQELAIGPDTGPQQPAPDSGPPDPVRQVREVPAARHGVPASHHLRVTVTTE